MLDLPQDLCIEIAACVGVTSERPLADLCSLPDTCSTKRRVCIHDEIGRRLSIEGIRDEMSWVKVVFMENRGCNDLRRATEGGHDAMSIY
jgi:hypothetical protein